MTHNQRQALINAAALVRRAQSMTAFVYSELTRDGNDKDAAVVAQATADLKRVAEQLVAAPPTVERKQQRAVPTPTPQTTPTEEARLVEQAKNFSVTKLPYMGDRFHDEP